MQSLRRTLLSFPLSLTPRHHLSSAATKGAPKKKKSNVIPAMKKKVSSKGSQGRMSAAGAGKGESIKSEYFTKIMQNENKRNIEKHEGGGRQRQRAPVTEEERTVSKLFYVETTKRHNTNEKILETKARIRELAISMLPTEEMKRDARSFLAKTPLDHAFPLNRLVPGWNPPREIFDEGKDESAEQAAAAAGREEKLRLEREAQEAKEKRKKMGHMKKAL